jgi:hypothetical protein
MGADQARGAAQDVRDDDVLAGGVRLNDGADQRLRHGFVVGEQLLGVLGQARAAIAEGGIVVVVADARIEADPVNDFARVEPLGERLCKDSTLLSR